MKTLDIIIACYNPSKHLENLLNSILKHINQLSQICVLIIDDCSKYGEEYKELIKKYNSYFKCQYFKTEKNSGPGNARNIGIENSSSDFMTFIDDDDEIINDIFYCLKPENISDYDFIITSKNEPNNEIIVNPGLVDSLQGLIFKSEFILKNNLYFLKHLTIGAEDSVFRATAFFLGENIKICNYQFYKRNYRNDSNFSKVHRKVYYNSPDQEKAFGQKNANIWLSNCFLSFSQHEKYNTYYINYCLKKLCFSSIYIDDDNGNNQIFFLKNNSNFSDHFYSLWIYGILKYYNQKEIQMSNSNDTYFGKSFNTFYNKLIDFVFKHFELTKDNILIFHGIYDKENLNFDQFKDYPNFYNFINELPQFTTYYDINSIINLYSHYYYNTYFENSVRNYEE